MSTLPVDLGGGRDKLAHFGAYLILGVLLARATGWQGWPAWAAIAIGLFYGFTDELHQSFVPGRTASVADWMADAAGTIAGVALYRLRAGSRGRVRQRARGRTAENPST